MKGHLAAFISVAIFVAACGDDAGTTAPPATDPPPTTTTSAPTTTQPPPTTTAPAATTTTAPAPTTTTTVAPTPTLPAPTDPPDEAPPILAAGPRGIVILGGQTIVPAIVDEPGVWVDAVPDGLGGLVYAAAGDAAQVIWWWPAGAGEPSIVSFKPGRFLHDVAVIDGRPTAIVVDNPDPSPDVEPADFVQLVDLETGDTTTTGRQIGGIEWGAPQVAYRDGVFLVTEVNHSCGDLLAFDLAGADVPLPLPEPPCAVHFELPFGGADFGPPGTGFAYVEHHYADTGKAGGELTGADLVVIGDDGAEQARVALGTAGVPYDGVDFDGRWAVVETRYDFEGDRYLDPRLVDTRTGSVWTLAGREATSFRFAPDPLQVG